MDEEANVLTCDLLLLSPRSDVSGRGAPHAHPGQRDWLSDGSRGGDRCLRAAQQVSCDAEPCELQLMVKGLQLTPSVRAVPAQQNAPIHVKSHTLKYGVATDES